MRGRWEARIRTPIFGTTGLIPRLNWIACSPCGLLRLQHFGLNAIPVGTPVSQLADVLVPLYLMHRYQTEAAAKEIGGLDYRYALRGDGQEVTAIVSAADQRKALAAVLRTLAPETLTLPEPLLRLLPPVPPGYPRTRESFAYLQRAGLRSGGGCRNRRPILRSPCSSIRNVLHGWWSITRATPEIPVWMRCLNGVLKATWEAPRASRPGGRNPVRGGIGNAGEPAWPGGFEAGIARGPRNRALCR